MKYLIRKPETFLNTLNDDINSILHRSFDNIFPEYIFQQEMKGMAMPVDIKEYEDSFDVKIELPGIDRKDIDIDLNKSFVKISANKEFREEENKKHKYHKTEFRYGNYYRTLYFPSEIDVEKSSADLKHGILELKLPKLEAEDKKTKRLEINE